LSLVSLGLGCLPFLAVAATIGRASTAARQLFVVRFAGDDRPTLVAWRLIGVHQIPATIVMPPLSNA